MRARKARSRNAVPSRSPNWGWVGFKCKIFYKANRFCIDMEEYVTSVGFHKTQVVAVTYCNHVASEGFHDFICLHFH